jgi:pilus assembly protein CpaB
MARHFGGAPVRGGNRTKIILVMLVVFFFLSAAFIFLLTRQKEGSAPKKVVNTEPGAREVQVLVPFEDIKPGFQLKNEMFKLENRPQLSVDDRTIKDFSQIIGYYAKTLILKGRPLHADFITLEKPTSVLSGMIPPGYRAVTISIDKIRGVEGWVRPGSKVDVYWLASLQGSTSLNVIVENAQVISVERKVTQDSPADAPVPGTVTLLVSADDAKKVSLATNTGTISLSLRSDVDNKGSGAQSGVSIADLVSGGRIKPETAKEVLRTGTLIVDGKEFWVTPQGALIPAQKKP